MENKIKISRALDVDSILAKKFIELQLSEEWQKVLGQPQADGVWIIWGNSGHGKSRFCMNLAKELARHVKVVYNPLEEGARKSLQRNVRDCNMTEVKRNFQVLQRESVDDMRVRLKRKQRPQVVFIDSFQYTGLTKKQYIALKTEFPDILFIFVSHAEGKEPAGNIAKFVRYDADIKIRVEGYKAFTMSRLGGGDPYLIWPEKAAEYWADITAT